MTKKLSLLIACLLFTAPAIAHADTLTNQLAPLQNEWAVIKYQTTDKDKRLKDIRALQGKAEALAAASPQRAEPKIWQAIALATEASFNRGLSSLPLVKRAKKLLEEAIAIDGKALGGLAYSYLGSLYDQVPGWPVGFGDDRKAAALFAQALAINASDIDANYFYGQHVLDEGRSDEALAILQKALTAPERPGRKTADTGRRAEIRMLIKRAEEKAKQQRHTEKTLNE